MKKGHCVSILFSLIVILAIMLIPAVSGCGAPSAGPSPAPSDSGVIELKWAGFDPPPATPYAHIMAPWAEQIEKDTNGRVKITLYGAESLGKAADQVEMVKNRVCDISNVMPAFTPGLFPLAEVIELPHLFPNAEICGRVAYELMSKYALDSELKDVKFLWVLGMTNQFPQSARELRTLEDWKGLKCLAEGKMDAAVIEAMGGSPVPMPMPEVYTGLQTGLIQAVNMSWEGTMVFKIHEATKYRVNYGMYSKAFLVLMNLDVWNGLPDDIKQVFEKYGGADESAKAGVIFEEKCDVFKVGPIADYDKEMGNTGAYDLTPEEADRWTAATATMIDDWIAEKEKAGLPGKAIVEDARSLIEKYSK